MFDDGEAACTVRLRQREVRECAVPDDGEAASEVRLRRCKVRECKVLDDGKAAWKVRVRRCKVWECAVLDDGERAPTLWLWKCTVWQQEETWLRGSAGTTTQESAGRGRSDETCGGVARCGGDLVHEEVLCRGGAL